MFERRLQVLLFVLSAVLVCLVCRAVAVQVAGGSYWTAQTEDLATSTVYFRTTRGRILDCKGRELAVDVPCIDACVDYRAIKFDHTTDSDIAWLRDIARQRVKQRTDNYADQPLSERKRLLAAEVKNVVRDIGQMWIDLATLSHHTPAQMDDQRREIIARVEARRQIVWSKKYGKAVDAGAVRQPWYVRWFSGEAGVDVDKYEVDVAEQTAPHVILPNIAYELRNELTQQSDRYPGLIIQAGIVRHYPYGSVACQVIGHVVKVTKQDIEADPNAGDPLLKLSAADDIGRDGLEGLLEPQLRGSRGQHSVDRDGTVTQIAAVPGTDVRVTLDAELQAKIEHAFTCIPFRIGVDFPEPVPTAMPGAAVVIDVPTGQVRAMVSAPTYDLNQYDERYAQLVIDNFNRPLSNRAISTAAQPGSTVKPIVGLGAITQGIMHADETILCSGFLVIGKITNRQSYRCWTERLGSLSEGFHRVPSRDPHPDGYLSFADALERSCNVFHETLGDKLGVGGLSYWFEKFGLGRKTGIGLRGEVIGQLPDRVPGPKPRSMAWNSAIGEEDVSATPIQMANVAATIARNGVWKRPTLKDEPTESVDLHLDPAALEQVHIGMKNVVGRVAGTGKDIHLDDVLVAGKTGSAQTSPLANLHRDAAGKLLRDEKGRVIFDLVPMGTSKQINPQVPWYRALEDPKTKEENIVPAHAWMMGYAPADAPKLAFAAFVEHGGGGGSAAAFVLKEALAGAVEQGYIQSVPGSGVLPSRPPWPTNPKIAFFQN